MGVERWSNRSQIAVVTTYLTLPYGEDVLSLSAEASNGPIAHPRINRKVTKSLPHIYKTSYWYIISSCVLTRFAGGDVGDPAGKSSADVVDGDDPHLVRRVRVERRHDELGPDHVRYLVVRSSRRVLAPVLHYVRLYGSRRVVVGSWFPVQPRRRRRHVGHANADRCLRHGCKLS